MTDDYPAMTVEQLIARLGKMDLNALVHLRVETSRSRGIIGVQDATVRHVFSHKQGEESVVELEGRAGG
jgi:hypothetical protein